PRNPDNPPISNDNHVSTDDHGSATSDSGGGGTGTLPTLPADPPRSPVRREAQIDPRYRDALQPPYPPAEQRLDHDGEVRVRVPIGADGRVIGVDQLSASSPAFWEATRQQALRRWRFRPATED